MKPYFHIICTALLALTTQLSLHAEEELIDFNEDIRTIFNASCVGCHGGVKKASELSFLSRDQALGRGKSGKHAIVPGHPEESELIARVTATDPNDRMPPADHGPALSPEELAKLEAWIRQGADWKEYWAFEKPEPQSLPETNSSWGSNRIDSFVLSRMTEAGLTPSDQAEPAALLRRLTFDIIGLPPTPEALEAFENDSRPDAIERVVDSLLASPAFGERWAPVWMDLARYADSDGLGLDGRRETWKYRDWIIDTFNANEGYDQFILDQLAGDLLPNPSTKQLVATAFHRQTQSNDEGGTDDEEFRVAAIIDRVNTTWEAFNGLTFGCTQCHSHPYDPYQFEDYYKFMAFFNNTADADVSEGFPQLRVPLNNYKVAEAEALDDEIERHQEVLKKEAHARFATTPWTAPTNATAESSTAMGISLRPHEDNIEFVTDGNIAHNTDFTFTFEAQGIEQLTALRIDLIPVDPETARHTPEWGGVLSQIILEQKGPDDEKFAPVTLERVVGDEPTLGYDPQESLKESGRGFGAYSKIFQPRWCVVIPENPIALTEGTQFRLRLNHRIHALGAFPLVTQRGSISLTDTSAWVDYLKDPTLAATFDALVDTEKQRQAIPSTTVPVIQERPKSLPRETRTFVRGNWLDKGELIKEPDVPASFPPLPKDAPKDRLALAKWMVGPDQPLTSRVLVNRLWEQLFDIGIVETLEDFGSAGAMPSHPHLLDDLAWRFQHEMDWDIKTLLREMVLSATYQQSAEVSRERYETDPSNRYLARGPRKRLRAEMVRDNALAVAGLLSSKRHGPPVRPPIPDGVWKPFANDPWKVSQKEDRYRRAVYTYWKRSIPFPSFAAFDSPSREICSNRRLPSNTPIQALTLLNDPAFAECARALGERMLGSASTLDDQVRFGYRACVSKDASPEFVAELSDLYRRVLPHYADPESLREGGHESSEAAAMEIVASVLLNLDETLTH